MKSRKDIIKKRKIKNQVVLQKNESSKKSYNKPFFDSAKPDFKLLITYWIQKLLSGFDSNPITSWQDIHISSFLQNKLLYENITSVFTKELCEATALAQNDKFIESGDIKLLKIGNLDYPKIHELVKSNIMFTSLTKDLTSYPAPCPSDHEQEDHPGIKLGDDYWRGSLIGNLVVHLDVGSEELLREAYKSLGYAQDPLNMTLGNYWHALRQISQRIPDIPESVSKIPHPSYHTNNLTAPLQSNLELLNNVFDLDETEFKIIAFVRLAHEFPLLQRAIELCRAEIKDQEIDWAYQVIAKALDYQEDLSKTYLSENSKLITSGLITCHFTPYSYDGQGFLQIFDCKGAPVFSQGEDCVFAIDFRKLYEPDIIFDDDHSSSTPYDYKDLPEIGETLLKELPEFIKNVPPCYELIAHNEEEVAKFADRSEISFPNILIIGSRNSNKAGLIHMIASAMHEPICLFSFKKSKNIAERIIGSYAIARNAYEYGYKLAAVEDTDLILRTIGNLQAKSNEEADEQKLARLKRLRCDFTAQLDKNKMPTFYLTDTIDELDDEIRKHFWLIIRLKDAGEESGTKTED